ncbi:MAG TPA: AAA family ATPase [Pseudobacteroides sp.]|uniref:AAA family ATPase n=1 Tax=Pseudobacteroides sp. TaxID=1968840 RepID=UPI002F94752F
MIIKRIEIAGFKNIPFHEPKKFEFYKDTLIQGENYSGKTSLGDALCWAFCGCNATGITAEYLLRNNDSTKTVVEVFFEDNSGIEHSLLREQSQETGKHHRLILDGIPVKDSDLAPYIMDKDIFLSTFMIGYFTRLSSKAAGDLLMSILPFPTNQSIIKRVETDLRQYLPMEEGFDSNTFLKNLRQDLKKVEDEIKIWTEKQKQAEEQIKRIPSGEHVDESKIKSRVDMLEARKENLIKASVQNNTASFLESKLSICRLEIQSLKNRINRGTPQFNKNCPTCGQTIPEAEIRKMQEKIDADNALLKSNLESLVKDETDLLSKIEEAQSMTKESNAIIEELDAVSKELDMVKAEYDKVIRQNEVLRSEKKKYDDAIASLDASKENMEKLSAKRYQLNRSITAASQYNSIKADLQYDTVRGSLKNVSIRLQKIVPSTNELRDCFEILYKGREFHVISTSESIRAGLEISALINSRINLKLPVFIDNAESITHYEKPPVQIFEAKVAKDIDITVSPNS